MHSCLLHALQVWPGLGWAGLPLQAYSVDGWAWEGGLIWEELKKKKKEKKTEYHLERLSIHEPICQNWRRGLQG